MKLYKASLKDSECCHEPATPDDVRAWAKANGFALVPLEPTERMLNETRDICIDNIHNPSWRWYVEGYKAMIQASEEA